jgi:uncharacterized protein YbaP (TraB family)
MRERFLRFFVVVALLVGCGSSKDTHVAPHAAPTATVASSVGAAPSASAAPSTTTAQTPPTEVKLPTQVAAPWHPLLYRVAGTKPSYLFGTIHIPDPRLASFPPALSKAVGDSDEIVNEMPLDDANDALAMMSSFRLPSGKSLSTELSPALYRRLKDAFTQKGLGMAFPMLEHMKVWAVAAQVALLDHLKEIGTGGGQAIDLAIHDMAKAAGKTTSGLETKAEQLAVFDGLTKDEQARLLEQTLDQRDKDAREGKDPVARLMTLYVAGEEAPLLHELNAGFDLSRPLDKKLLTRLITDRNKRMVTRIAALFKAHPRRAYFVAVGAAHLLGDDGIIAQLKKKGMRIERVQ